jgi:transcriptional regulator with XRE-family HTH domain
MIDFKLLRKGLHITQNELAEITRITGITRFRSVMAEIGLLAFSPDEEFILRLAIGYTMHRRSFSLAAKVAQGLSVRSPMTWDQYAKEHGKKKQKEQCMKVIVISLELVEDEGRFLFPLSEIPWNIDINDKAVKVLATCPSVLESMIAGIRTVVAMHSEP